MIAALALVTGALSARLLGPQGRGELAAVQLWPGFIMGPAMLGAPDALVYLIAREARQARALLFTALGLTLASTLMCAAGAYSVMPWLLRSQAPAVVATAQWYMAVMLLYALMLESMAVLRATGQFVTWNILRVAPISGWLLLLVAAYGLARPSVQFLSMGVMLYLALIASVALVLALSSTERTGWTGRAMAEPLLRFGVPSAMGGVPSVLNIHGDQLVMAALLSPKDLGLYTVAVGWSWALLPLLTSVGLATFPELAAESDVDRRHLRLAESTRLGIMVGTITGLGLLIATPLLLPEIFGASFRAAVGGALILVVAAVVLGSNLIMEEGLRGLGQPKSVLRAEACGLAITLLVLWLLLRPLGIRGAALASLGGYSSAGVVLLLEIRRLTGLSFGSLLIPSRNEVVACGRILAVVLPVLIPYLASEPASDR